MLGWLKRNFTELVRLRHPPYLTATGTLNQYDSNADEVLSILRATGGTYRHTKEDLDVIFNDLHGVESPVGEVFKFRSDVLANSTFSLRAATLHQLSSGEETVFVVLDELTYGLVLRVTVTPDSFHEVFRSFKLEEVSQ